MITRSPASLAPDLIAVRIAVELTPTELQPSIDTAEDGVAGRTKIRRRDSFPATSPWSISALRHRQEY